MSDPRSPSQTVGPFFGFALSWPGGPHAVAGDAPGAIFVRGRLLDGRADPVTDGLIETWQPPDARADGAVEGGARGFTRSATDREGRYALVTLRPRPIAGAGGIVHAPHLLVSVFARGLLRRLVTRIYFPDGASDGDRANDRNPVLSAVADAAARATLVAGRDPDRPGGGYLFDIRLQGSGETVFFDV